MKNTIYLNCKAILKETASEAKKTNSKDKPYIRQCINDECDSLHRQIDFHAMRATISEKQANLYKLWLSNYACTLHP